MRAVSLLLAPLAAPLFFASPVDTAFLPTCCVSDGSVEPEDVSPILVGAKVRRPDEVALEANAEEPRPEKAPLTDAVAIPDKDETPPRIIVPPTPIPVVADDDASPNRDIDNPNTEPCCGPAEAEPEDPPPVFAGANVRNPDERALEAAAEAPVPDEILVADAIGETLNELPELPGPVREPIIAEGYSAPISDGPIDLSGCCEPAKGKTHPPDRHPEQEVSPPLVAAKVKNREKVHLLEMAAEAPVSEEVPFVNAIGVPLYPIEEERRGVSEPDFVPTVEHATLAPITGGSESYPGCCQPAKGKTHPPDRHPEEEVSPPLVGAKVKNRETERLLEMAAQAPVSEDVPLVNAIGVPLYPIEKERRGVSEPDFRPVTAELTAPDPTEQVQGIDDHGVPCCTAPEPEDPFEFVGAKAKNRNERALEATAVAPVPVKAPRTVAIARPLDERPVVAEPARMPVTLLLVLLVLLTIGLFRPWRRRRELREDEAAPTMRPLWDQLATPAAAPQPEPEVALARAKAEARELEPA